MVKTSASDNHSVDVTLTRHQRLRNQQEKCWCFKRIDKDSMRYEFGKGNEMLFNDINKMTGNKPNRRNDNSIEIRCFGARHEIIAHKLSPVEWERKKKHERE